MSRDVDLIVVHCTATPAGREVTVEDVDQWHRDRGWSGIGYHWLIGLGGEKWRGRDEDVVGAHVRGWNAHSIGVCYVGGGNRPPYEDTRTAAQKAALREVLEDIVSRYPIKRIAGHNELANKACPCFDARAEYWDLVHPGRPAVGADDEAVTPDDLLEEGAIGEDVYAWQRDLVEFGYVWIDVDGFFGPETAGLTQAFQIARGIVADGIVGPQTRDTMADTLEALELAEL